MTRIPWFLDALRADVKHAIRRLVKDCQFSAGAIAILALGIGANTAVFSLLNNSLFQPHPFTESERLVNVYQNDRKSGEPEGVSYPAFLDLQKETAVFAGVAASHLREVRYQLVDRQGSVGAVRQGLMEYASANYLDVVEMRPSMGRWFSPEEERSGEPVAVLGWQVWQRGFAGDPNILARALNVGGTAVHVIGVGPMNLNSAASTALFTSLWMPVKRAERRDELNLQVRARLRDGVTVQQAQAAMNVTAQRLAADHRETDPKRGIAVIATDDVHVHPREKFLKPLAVTVLSVVGLVLAIACSNLATLLLVRSSSRMVEFSVRLALGASRWQLARHLLLESMVLSLAGAGAGVAIANWGLRYLATIDLPIALSMQVDHRVLAFAIAVATVCGVGFGLIPALQVTRADIAAALREDRGSASGALSFVRGWFTPKNLLVMGQVAASFALLVGAVVAMNIVKETEQRGVGYRAEGLAIVEFDPKYAGYDVARAQALYEDLRRRVAAMPGVESVFVTSGLPVEGQFEKEFRLESDETLKVEGRWANPGYFQTLAIPVLFGRVFDERDQSGSSEKIVVSEAFALRLFGSANAVGKLLCMECAGAKRVEIIGVVGNTRSIDKVSNSPEKFFYRSALQAGVMPTTIVARASRNENAFVGTIQEEVRRLHPELPAMNAMTMKGRQEQELTPFHVAAVSLGTLGGLGLLLAGVGLYSVIAYAVAQRTSEFGIRLALGAHAGHLAWVAVRDVLMLVAGGIGIGAALSWAAIVALERSVAQIVGLNLTALLPAMLMIVLSGAVAAYAPARRAVRTDPLVAMRRR